MKYINLIVAFLMGIPFALAVSHTPQVSLRRWPRPKIKTNSKARRYLPLSRTPSRASMATTPSRTSSGRSPSAPTAPRPSPARSRTSSATSRSSRPRSSRQTTSLPPLRTPPPTTLRPSTAPCRPRSLDQTMSTATPWPLSRSRRESWMASDTSMGSPANRRTTL